MKFPILILTFLLISSMKAAQTHAEMEAMMKVVKEASEAENKVMEVFNDLR